MKRAIAPLAAAALLSACASQGPFPSLAKRPQETELAGGQGAAPRIAGSGQPATPASDVPATQQPVAAALAARLDDLREAARAAHERFQGKRPRTGQLVAQANGAATASEAWSVATVALADLESARSDTMVPLGELDRLYAAERIDGGDGGAIAAVRDQVTAWVADEDAVLAELGGRLKG